MKVNIMKEVFPHNEIPGLYGRIYPHEGDFEHRDRESYPLVNVAEDTGFFYVRALMPGADPRDLKLVMRGATLSLEGIIPKIKGAFHQQERFSGAFRRDVAFTMGVLPHKAHAVIKQGILDIVLPKAL